MLKNKSLLLAICLGWTSFLQADEVLPLKTHPDSSGWKNLFEANLSNAISSPGIWAFKDGELTATEDQIIWTKEQYSDSIVDLEFKTTAGSNSGVFIYCSDIQDWLSSSVEIQILDDSDPKWATVPKTWTCGGIFGHLAPTKSAVKKAGQWNRMTIACKGPMIYVLLNGEQVAQMDMKKWTSVNKNPDGSDIPTWFKKPLADLPTIGHVGLQGKHGGVPIYFRNLKIKLL